MTSVLADLAVAIGASIELSVLTKAQSFTFSPTCHTRGETHASFGAPPNEN
ncbi:MAG: hypothetical protein QOI88_1664 [Gammaproteobacteria bacterium]|nr:hypothetical protein [Gammaproteobacteria bacterium]